MDRIAVGNDEAMMLLYDRYSRLVFSLAVHILTDKYIAEDVTQEVFLHIWRNASSFKCERGSLASWLTVITRHRAIDVLRKRSRESSTDADGPSDIPGPSNGNVHSQIELWEAAAKVAAVFPSMPLSQRVALGLAYFSGLSHSEISSKTGEPLGTVKSRIRLALEFLRKALVKQEMLKCSPSVDPTSRKNCI
jgi:RNA polymerase sigma-70 factor, ECF subfamily